MYIPYECARYIELDHGIFCPRLEAMGQHEFKALLKSRPLTLRPLGRSNVYDYEFS